MPSVLSERGYKVNYNTNDKKKKEKRVNEKEKEDKIITVRCFGKLAIFVDGVEQSAYMNSQKARELIAFLITYRGEAVNKSTVCQALWEDKPIEYSKDSLYKLVKKIDDMPIPFIIRNSRGMIQLCIDNIDCDIVTFERLLYDRESIEKKEYAVSLYRGSLFEEENFNWIYLKDGFYDNRYVEALNSLYEHYEQKHNKKKAAYYEELIDYFN